MEPTAITIPLRHPFALDESCKQRDASLPMIELTADELDEISGGKIVVKYYRNGNVKKIVMT